MHVSPMYKAYHMLRRISSTLTTDCDPSFKDFFDWIDFLDRKFYRENVFFIFYYVQKECFSATDKLAFSEFLLFLNRKNIFILHFYLCVSQCCVFVCVCVVGCVYVCASVSACVFFLCFPL